eukprot:CAMPEP_0116972358 /NCGR_PEP_ID=MMETSP0467-20121206/53797_1 /TAXON_ID=283647 /ORGANISM="Mesodinium pulex, Strain SPMC105" /LENGTH=139 /DNA_ID=CAMNT_0004663839 /DNA_START=502 /DNA_END=921 /DNA_ORIENTATION=-
MHAQFYVRITAAVDVELHRIRIEVGVEVFKIDFIFVLQFLLPGAGHVGVAVSGVEVDARRHRTREESVFGVPVLGVHELTARNATRVNVGQEVRIVLCTQIPTKTGLHVHRLAALEIHGLAVVFVIDAQLVENAQALPE